YRETNEKPDGSQVAGVDARHVADQRHVGGEVVDGPYGAVEEVDVGLGQAERGVRELAGEGVDAVAGRSVQGTIEVIIAEGCDDAGMGFFAVGCRLRNA